MIDLSKITGFNWNDGKACKNDKHGVSMAEVEQVYFTPPLLLEDAVHSPLEIRVHALGKTAGGRAPHISFTLREANQLICVISARDMHRKEGAIYDQDS